jgi:small-conductance mechanosensitive channel
MTERMPSWDADTVALVAYLAVVVAFGLFVSLRVAASLRRVQRLRSARVKARSRFDAMRTEGPTAYNQQVARDRALESIERQATVMSRAAIPTIVVFTALLAGIPFLGDVPASVVTVVAAAVTVVLGIAGRPIIENAMAGLVLSGSKLVNLGDTIQIDDIYGSVEDITPTHTTIKVWDWRRFVVPNAQMIQSSLYNYSLVDRFIWAKVEFWVSYDADLERIREEAIRIAEESRYFSGRETPECWAMEMGERGVRLWLAAWAATPSDGWMLTHDVRMRLTPRLRELGVLPQIIYHQPLSTLDAGASVPTDRP